MADAADDTDDDTTPVQTADATPAAPAPSPQPAPSSGPDFTSMVRPPSDMAAVQSQMSGIQRAKTASDAAIASETAQRLDADRARMEAAYKASAAVPEELQHGWDVKAKMAEHTTDPVSAFGSTGSVFAMLASSFARVPMEQALNAGAAAINAIHTGDEAAYQKEFAAWKANTDLALKRHEIERQAYNDATNLMNSNINAGRTKMELAATKFGDQKTQALLDAGMDKELLDLMDSRNKAALGLQDQWDKVELQHEKVMDLKADPRYQSGNFAEKQQAIQDWNQRWATGGAAKLKYDFVQDYISAFKKANPNYTLEDLARARTEAADAEGAGGMKANTPEKAFIADKTKQLQETENRDPTADDRAQWAQEWATMKKGKSTSSGAQRAAEIDRRKQDYIAQGMPEGQAYTKAAQEVAQANVTMSGNRRDDIDKQINQFDNGKNAIDRALASIDKHWGAVGVAGYATRGAERVGNIFGSNDTDRSQLAHDIQYLQTIAPRLMQDASSRGLKADAEKISAIIAGLNLGDTTANTKRALSEVRELWDKMQQDNLARRSGTPNLPPAATGSSNTPPASAPTSGGAKTPKWQSAPIVTPGQRTEAEGESAYG